MAKRNWLKELFRPKHKQITFNEAVSMKGYEPTFSSFGSSTFYSDIVLSAIHMKMRFFGKLNPRHVRNVSGRNETILDSSVAKILKRPNAYQTTYDFLTQAYFMRELQDNCFIFPDYQIKANGVKEYLGLYILLPSQNPTIYDNGDGTFNIGFQIDGYEGEIIFALNEIVIWKKNIEDNTFLGGGKFSKNAKADLLGSLEAYHGLKEATKEASKLSCMFDGILKVNAFAQDDEAIANIRNKFVDDLRKNGNGLAVLDNGVEYQAISRQLKMADAGTLAEIKQNVLIHTGVSLEMLQGKFTTTEKEAFYENHIEPSAISLAQALTKVLFSDWQQSHGDEVVLYHRKIQLMSTTEITSIVQATAPMGVFTIDEYREMYGFAPLPNGEGEARPRGYNNLDGETTPTEETGEL